MKIITIIGARPQFIKAAVISREIARHDNIEEIIIHTGQHYDANMSEIFFEQMQIPKPHYNLGISAKTHGVMTGQMLEKIEAVLLDEKPDWVIVYGDTNSTLAGALAAKKLHIKIAHVEAGLRSFNMQMPEEINRILTDRISNVLFCPTDAAIENLKNEGFESFECRIVKSGDVMNDGALFYSALAQKPQVGIEGEFILSTIHRAENTDDPGRLKNIIDALSEIADDTPVVLPLHPRTRAILKQHDYKLNEHLHVIEPVGYLQMVWLIKNAKLIMTDSGGLQKEAFFFHKHCITLRDETEWIELIENRFNVLAGADKERILDFYHHFHFNDDFEIDLYGAGKAAETIVSVLMETMK